MNYWIILTILLGLIAAIVGVFVLFVMQKKKKEEPIKSLIIGLFLLWESVLFQWV